jgi:hypothetical protein
METPATQPPSKFKKPIGGFVVVLVSALLIGGWLYVDMVKNELETKVQDLEAELDAARLRAAQEAETPEPEPSVPAPEWKAYSAELDGHRFQVNLPDGFTLSVGASVTSIAYVLADPVVDGELPYMTIQVAPISDKGSFRSGGVMVEHGEHLFWLSLWEGMEWEPFAKVAASFKPL